MDPWLMKDCPLIVRHASWLEILLAVLPDTWRRTSAACCLKVKQSHPSIEPYQNLVCNLLKKILQKILCILKHYTLSKNNCEGVGGDWEVGGGSSRTHKKRIGGVQLNKTQHHLWTAWLLFPTKEYLVQYFCMELEGCDTDTDYYYKKMH